MVIKVEIIEDRGEGVITVSREVSELSLTQAKEGPEKRLWWIVEGMISIIRGGR